MPDPDGSLQELTDGALQSEIELVGELVVAATSASGPLGQAQIDRLLGIGQLPDAGPAGATVPDDSSAAHH